jgi:hypothetical protein
MWSLENHELMLQVEKKFHWEKFDLEERNRLRKIDEIMHGRNENEEKK